MEDKNHTPDVKNEQELRKRFRRSLYNDGYVEVKQDHNYDIPLQKIRDDLQLYVIDERDAKNIAFHLMKYESSKKIIMDALLSDKLLFNDRCGICKKTDKFIEITKPKLQYIALLLVIIGAICGFVKYFAK